MDEQRETTRVPLATPQSRWALLIILGGPFFVLLLALPVVALTRDGLPSSLIAFCVLSPIAIAAGVWLRIRGRDMRDWSFVPFLEFRPGHIIAIPAAMHGLPHAEVAFPSGSHLELHAETGDAFFDGDRGQYLRSTMWVGTRDGGRYKVPFGEWEFIDPTVATENLQQAGVEMRFVRVYDSRRGEHTETTVTLPSVARRHSVLLTVIAGMSSLWLGALVGVFVRSWALSVVIGAAAFLIVAALATLFSKAATRATLISVASMLPTYAATYCAVVLVIRYLHLR